MLSKEERPYCALQHGPNPLSSPAPGATDCLGSNYPTNKLTSLPHRIHAFWMSFRRSSGAARAQLSVHTASLSKVARALLKLTARHL